MFLRHALSQQQVGHEQQVQQLTNDLEHGGRRRLAEAESNAEAFVMAERQRHEHELAAVRRQHVSQLTPVSMEQTPLPEEPKKAIKHDLTPSSTRQRGPKSKSMATPSCLNQALSLPPPAISSSSSSSKTLPAPAPQTQATTRKGIRKETNEPEALPQRGRAVTVDTTSEAPLPSARRRAVSVDTAKRLVPSQIGIQAVREELENAKNKGLSTEDISEYLKLYDDWRNAKGNTDAKKQKLKGLRKNYKRTVYKRYKIINQLINFHFLFHD